MRLLLLGHAAGELLGNLSGIGEVAEGLDDHIAVFVSSAICTRVATALDDIRVLCQSKNLRLIPEPATERVLEEEEITVGELLKAPLYGESQSVQVCLTKFIEFLTSIR